MRDKLKKILIVNKYHFLSGGAERYFLSLMEALRRRGFEPIPFSVNYSRTLPTPYQKYFIEPVIKEGEAKILKQRPNWKEKISLAKQAIYNTRAFEAARRICEDHKPDIAYLLNFNNHISPSVIDACRNAGIPVVMRMSDFNLVCASNMYYRDGHPCVDCKKGLHHAIIHRCVHGSLTRSVVSVFAMSFHRWAKIYKKVSAFVAPTNFMKQELMELGFSENIIHQINTFAEPQGMPEPDRQAPYILFVGRFARYKGVDTALEAFSRIRNKKGVTFRFIGDEGDADARRVKEKARDLHCQNVEFLPFERDKKKIIEAIQKSLFTVLPSENYENLPNVILESFSCGRAVISTRLGSIPDVVKEGEYGLLYDYGNIEELKQKMEWLIENESAREEMGQKALAAVRRDYSEKQHLDQLLDLFESLQQGNSPISLPESPTLLSAIR
ncbi:MAG TPA: glycosyltransferase family 4 protein [bacterium]|nr:glycosyltransferase family 4 protein [bacterium]